MQRPHVSPPSRPCCLMTAQPVPSYCDWKDFPPCGFTLLCELCYMKIKRCPRSVSESACGCCCCGAWWTRHASACVFPRVPGAPNTPVHPLLLCTLSFQCRANMSVGPSFATFHVFAHGCWRKVLTCSPMQCDIRLSVSVVFWQSRQTKTSKHVLSLLP